jgi:5-formyltetrahydrofolate cyclo-ligase
MIEADKEALRREARALRKSLHAAQPDIGDALARNFQDGLPLPPRAAVAGFLPVREEADPTVLMAALRARGHAILLPRVVAIGAPLGFHLWEAGAAPMVGAFGLYEPAPDWPQATPDIVLVPLLAFDGAGYRLGYGGGYYDRTLRLLRQERPVIAVGIGFAGQERSDLPHDHHDERLDWMVTEADVKHFARA